jgi:hypothetical protein
VAHNIIANMEDGGENIAMPKIRAALARQHEKFANQYVLGPMRNNRLFTLPERFFSVV